MISTLPLQFGIPGGPELLVILLIAVLLFGANKIPKLARSTGEAMGEFQKGREEVEQELQEMREGPKNEDENAPSTSNDRSIETEESPIETEESPIETEESPIETEPEVETESETEEDAEIAEAETEEESNR